jgi:G3E family GTPase
MSSPEPVDNSKHFTRSGEDHHKAEWREYWMKRFSEAHLPPVIYHLAEAVNWPSIERSGLLSTRALLDAAGISEEEHRKEQMILPNGTVIRDQKPMPPAALERCLHDMTPAQWYTLLNSKVFFWLDVDRLNRMRRASGEQAQVVMIIDTERLLSYHSERIALTPINTGNARRRPAQRGLHTFVPYQTWIESGWASETQVSGTSMRPRNHQPVELTVSDAVLNVLDCMSEMRHLEPMELFCP